MISLIQEVRLSVTSVQVSSAVVGTVASQLKGSWFEPDLLAEFLCSPCNKLLNCTLPRAQSQLGLVSASL